MKCIQRCNFRISECTRKFIDSFLEKKLRIWIWLTLWLGSFSAYLLRIPQPRLYVREDAEFNPNLYCRTSASTYLYSLDSPISRMDENTIMLVDYSYSIGFILTSLVVGWIIEWYGTRYIVGGTMLLGALCNILIIGLADQHWAFMVTLRLITGIAGSFFFPSLHHLTAEWALPRERGKFLAATEAWSICIFVIQNFSSLITVHVGWEAYYYFTSIWVFIVAVIWLWVVEESPAVSKRITEKERDIILTVTHHYIDRTRVVPPYLKLISSVPYWALVVAHVGNLIGAYTYASVIIDYFTTILGYNTRGYIFAISFAGVTRYCGAVFFGWTADFMRKKRIMKRRTIRNIHVCASFFFFGIATVECRPKSFVILVWIAQIFGGAMTGGYLQGCLDLAPNFVATQYGFMQAVAQTMALIIPTLERDFSRTELREWTNYFKIWAIVLAFSGIFYMVFGAAYSTEGLNDKQKKKTGGLLNRIAAIL